MAILSEYHKPKTLAEAIQLLRRTDVHLVPLAGGAQLVGELETRQRRDVDGVVDLAGLGLNRIEQRDDVLHVGATTTITDLIEHPVALNLADGVLPRTARGEGPINLRNQATIGGIVATAAHDSELYAALLALGASVVTSDGESEIVTDLTERFPNRSSLPSPQRGEVRRELITQIRIPLADRSSGHARVARTPSDRPIVAAVAVIGDGIERIALCGIAPTPILDGQQVPAAFSDFKGSAEYRLAAADVVKHRALEEAKGG